MTSNEGQPSETQRLVTQELATHPPRMASSHDVESTQSFPDQLQENLSALRSLINSLNELKHKYPVTVAAANTIHEDEAYYAEFAGRLMDVLAFSNFDAVERMWLKHEWLQEFAHDVPFDDSVRAMRDDPVQTPLLLDEFVTFVHGQAYLDQLMKKISFRVRGSRPSNSTNIVVSDTEWFVENHHELTTKLCLSTWTVHVPNKLRVTVTRRLRLFTRLMTNEIASEPSQCIELLKSKGTQSWSSSAAFLLAENFALKQIIESQEAKLKKLEVPRECLVYRGCFEQLARRYKEDRGGEKISWQEACSRFWDQKVEEAAADRHGPVWDILETMLVTVYDPPAPIDTEDYDEGNWADLPGNPAPRYDGRDIEKKSQDLKDLGHGLYGRLSIPIHGFPLTDPDWYRLESRYWHDKERQILNALATLYRP